MRRGIGCLLCLLALYQTGCMLRVHPFAAIRGSGTLATETRDVGNFTELEFRGSGQLNVLVGQPPAVVLELDDNLLPLIRTEVQDGRLVIDNEKSYHTTHRLRLNITVPSLQELTMSGAGDVSITQLDAQRFQLQLNGSSDLTAQGSAESLSIDINGSGDVDFTDVVSQEAAVTIRGSGDVQLHVLGRLSAAIYGSGNVLYRGEPQVEQTVRGSGSIAQLKPDGPAEKE